MLIGEAPCTKDLINCTDRDFKVVSAISIAAIFVIIALVLKSFSLPILLVAMIELAIALNLCIPYFTDTTLPFVGPILISTIQLGATVDYAILMTTRYKQGRSVGKSKKKLSVKRLPLPRSPFWSAVSAFSPQPSASACTPTSILFLRCAA
ncbi:MAG: MMPL family transporter [Christensenellales bacterium]